MNKIRCIEYIIYNIYIYIYAYEYIYRRTHTHRTRYLKFCQLFASVSGEAKSCTVSWCQTLSAATLRTSLLEAWCPTPAWGPWPTFAEVAGSDWGQLLNLLKLEYIFIHWVLGLPISAVHQTWSGLGRRGAAKGTSSLPVCILLYGCWTKNRGCFTPKMDGENNGKPYENGWFGVPTPIFGNIRIVSTYLVGFFHVWVATIVSARPMSWLWIPRDDLSPRALEAFRWHRWQRALEAFLVRL